MKWEKEREGASGGREIERWGGAESNEDAGKKGVKTWKQLTTPGIPFMPWMAVRNKISSVADATRGAAGGNFLVATAFSMEFMLAAASCRKLHARIQDDTAAASRHTIKVALSESL